MVVAMPDLKLARNCRGANPHKVRQATARRRRSSKRDLISGLGVIQKVLNLSVKGSQPSQLEHIVACVKWRSKAS
jgi:hypothetical protein